MGGLIMYIDEIGEMCNTYKSFIRRYLDKTNNGKGAVDICSKVIRDSKNNAITCRAAIASIIANSTIIDSTMFLPPTYVCVSQYKRYKKIISKGKKIQLPVYGNDGSILSWIRV